MIKKIPRVFECLFLIYVSHQPILIPLTYKLMVFLCKDMIRNSWMSIFLIIVAIIIVITEAFLIDVCLKTILNENIYNLLYGGKET